jgi:hypothetical protein
MSKYNDLVTAIDAIRAETPAKKGGQLTTACCLNWR